MQMLMRFFKDEEGVVMIEYALIGALIGVALIVTLIALAAEQPDIYQRLLADLASA